MGLSKQGLSIILLQPFKLGHSASETTSNIIKSLGFECVPDRTVCKWFENFRVR